MAKLKSSRRVLSPPSLSIHPRKNYHPSTTLTSTMYASGLVAGGAP